MKRLAVYVQHLTKYSGEALTLSSGAPVSVRFPTGERASTQSVDHSQIVAMVQEAAPPDALADVRAGRATRFEFDEAGAPVFVDVTPSGNTWRVVITPRSGPGAVDAGAVTAPQPVAPPPPASVRGVETWDEGGAASIDRWLRMVTKAGGSDLHVSSNNPPMFRLHGEMRRLEETAPYEHERLKKLIYEIMPVRNREEFERRNDTDWAHEIAGLARFRANAFMDRRGICAVLRRIPYEIMSPEQLGLPRTVLDLCNLTKGLVVVTGPTGSGKSTTLATLIDVINRSRDDHIITIEDPIEFVHDNKRCLVNQREVHTHTDGFKDALRAALREDPDIVLVGEMRDLETIAIAIETAETGHLVFGTLHTSTAPTTVDRIIDQFASDRQAQIRTMLSESLKGVIAQVLCRKVGGGRIAAYEILIGTPAIANLIREGKTFQIPGIMQTARNVGMCTMNDSLMDFAKRGLIEPREAYLKAVNKSEMRTLMTQAGMEIPTVG